MRPNWLARAVSRTRGIRSNAAARTASSMRNVPSAIENSLCRRRWTKPGDDMRRAMPDARILLRPFRTNRIDHRCHSLTDDHNFVARDHARTRDCDDVWGTARRLRHCAVRRAATAGCAASARAHRAADAAQCRAAAAADQPVWLPPALSARLCGWLCERDRCRAQGCVAFRRRSELPYGLAGRNRALQEKIASPRTPPTSHFVDVRGDRHHVLTWGDPHATPLVLLHGWMDVGASFQFLVDALARDWYAIAPDLRGFGDSAWQPQGYWYHDYLADLEALLDRLVPKQPVRLVGHSLGGNVVMHYAGVRPSRVDRVVSLEGFGIPAEVADAAPRKIAKWLDAITKPPRFKPYDDIAAVAD